MPEENTTGMRKRLGGIIQQRYRRLLLADDA
jgi:hypothetical protein